jgi:predicted ribosomally synthesized peptide with nif11-like leader
MSVESAKKFIERLASDAEFRTQVESAADPVAKKKLVQEAGFDFDMADIAAVLPESAGGELSDAELEGVAGGLTAGETASAAVSAGVGSAIVSVATVVAATNIVTAVVGGAAAAAAAI